MSRPWRLAGELTFSAVTTAETARQQLLDSAGGALPSHRIKEIHLQRVEGAGTIAFTARCWSAASGGKLRATTAITLAIAGGPTAHGYTAGLDVLVEAGSFWTLEAASGIDHKVKLLVTYGAARDF